MDRCHPRHGVNVQWVLRRVISFCLQSRGVLTMLRADMSNRALWSMRKRHEWLATPLKKKRVKKATRLRCGLQDAMDRKATVEKTS